MSDQKLFNKRTNDKMMLLYYCYPKGLCRSVALWQLRTLGGLSNVTIFKIIIFGGLEIG